MSKTFERLTRPIVRKLAPGARITEHGITFERSPTGDGIYSINIMVDGRRIHRVIGRESDGTTRTQAEEFIAKVRSDAKNDRLALPKGRKVALSFRDAAKSYLDRLTLGDGRDLKMKRARLDLHLIPFLGDLPLSKVSSFDIERYKRQRTGERAIKSNSRGQGRTTYKSGNASVATINRELAVLSHLFSKALDWGWVDRRPGKINRYKEANARITYLTVEQIANLIEHAKADQNSQIYPFIVIGLETSMRRMEILSISRDNVDVERKLIFIPLAKSGAREQPITTHLADFLKGYLAALPKGSPWLFPSPGAKGGHTMDVRKAFRRVVIAAGLDPNQVVRHTLRHTAITHLVQAGVDLPTVKRISGHKTLAMVERYAHANGEHIQAAMDRLQVRMKLTG